MRGRVLWAGLALLGASLGLVMAASIPWAAPPPVFEDDVDAGDS